MFLIDKSKKIFVERETAFSELSNKGWAEEHSRVLGIVSLARL
jgi:hypothetical protein